jgi:hypothetical protein
MNYLKLSICFALMTAFNLKLGATHMMGADMTCQSLGNGKYKIIAKVYRDCRGIAFNSPSFQAFAGLSGSNTCGTYNLSITRTNIKDITYTCSTSSKPCNPQNTGLTGEGIEEHTFEAIVDFNKVPLSNFTNKSSCCEVTFAIGQCCRNDAITTGPANNDFWSTCMINICNLQKTIKKTNNTPIYSTVPVGFICCNTTFYGNYGNVDSADNDSLGYKLVPGINSLPNTSVNYFSPFTPRYPMTPFCIPSGKVDCSPNMNLKPARGFYFDSSKGDFVFTPIKCDEVGIIVIEISEFRKDSSTGKWLTIGKTRRDMQYVVKNDCGNNNSPVITGSANNVVCEGDKICIKIDGTDAIFTPNQIIPDTVKLSWNKGIPDATFTVLNPSDREKQAEFCWQTKVGQASDNAYSFTVTATDDHCPKPAISIRGFKVAVKPRATSIRKYSTYQCRYVVCESVLPTSFKGNASYKWSLRDSTGNVEYYYSAKSKDTFQYPYGGKYIMIHTINNLSNCPTIYRDTLILNSNPPIKLKDTTYNQRILQAPLSNIIVTSQHDSTLNVKWTVIDKPAGRDTAGIITENPVKSKKYHLNFAKNSDTGTYLLQYCVTDKKTGCQSCDTSQIKINPDTTKSNTNLITSAIAFKIWPNPLQYGYWRIAELPADAILTLKTMDGKILITEKLKAGVESQFGNDCIPSGMFVLVLDLGIHGKYNVKLLKL